MGTKRIALACACVVALVGVPSDGQAQPRAGAKADKLVIGMFAPTVEFGTSQARLAYVQALAKAIAASTGIRAEGRSFASFAALQKGGVDFAIVEAQCVATNDGLKLLANAKVEGVTARRWALFSASEGAFSALRGKKLAYVATGCADSAFIDNVMLESEVEPGFFGARIGKADLTAAVAEVASYKAAQAVFAPTAGRGLVKVFDSSTPVPTPGFVAMRAGLTAELRGRVVSAVLSFRQSDAAIDGFVAANQQAYDSLSSRLRKANKVGVFAVPPRMRFDTEGVFILPPSLGEFATTSVRQHFVMPPTRLD